MPLYDVTFGSQLVDPSDCEAYDLLRALKRKMHKATLNRCWKTVREAVDDVRPSASSKLVWTKMAALFGETSGRPKKDVDHLWDSVQEIVGDDKHCLQAIGAMLRAVVAERPETWLVYRQDLGNVDPDTGKKITVSTYWIDSNYRPVRIKKPKEKPVQMVSNLSLQEQLAMHFNV